MTRGAWDRLAAVLDRVGFDRSGPLRGGVSDADVAAAQDSLGMELHPEVLAFYRLTDGIDEAAWNDRYFGLLPRLVPGLAFPAARRAAEIGREMREVAEEFEEAAVMWDPGFLPVFPAGSDRAIVVDQTTGKVWFVSWEETMVHVVADSLADYLGMCADLIETSGAGFDGDGGFWEFPDGYEGPEFAQEQLPGGEVRDAPPGPVVYDEPTSLSVADAFADLLEAHREMGSWMPDSLRPPAAPEAIAGVEARVGFSLHPDLRELLGICEGVDPAGRPGTSPLPAFLPRLKFPDLQTLVEHWQALRDKAMGFTAGDRTWWGEEWFPCFVGSTGRALVVDCAETRGTVWRVEWDWFDTTAPTNPDWIRPIAPNLATFLAESAARMRRNDLVIDTHDGSVTWRRDWGGEQFL